VSTSEEQRRFVGGGGFMVLDGDGVGCGAYVRLYSSEIVR